MGRHTTCHSLRGHCPRFVTRHVLTCLSAHVPHSPRVLFIFCHCWLTRRWQHGADGTGVYCDTGSLHTGVYCDPGSLCTGVYRGWWCGRGEGGPGTDPLLTVRGPALTAAPPPAPPQTLVTSHSGECPTSTLQSTMLFDDRQFCFNISG